MRIDGPLRQFRARSPSVRHHPHRRIPIRRHRRLQTIEGASYLLQTFPDKRLEAYIDSVLTLVAAAQEPDGYLYTARTMNPAHPHDWAGSRRWEAVENLSHEFYNLGHMVEGAVAHFQATGKRNFLDIATRYADCVVRSIGTAPARPTACRAIR